MILHARSHACANFCRVDLDGETLDRCFYAVEGDEDGLALAARRLDCGHSEVEIKRGKVEIRLSNIGTIPDWVQRWWETERDRLMITVRNPTVENMVEGETLPVSYVCLYGSAADKITQAMRHDRSILTGTDIGIAVFRGLVSVNDQTAGLFSIELNLATPMGGYVGSMGGAFQWFAFVPEGADKPIKLAVDADSLTTIGNVADDE